MNAKQSQKAKWAIIFFGLAMGGVAAAALRLNKLEVTTSCRDVRLYMDGGYFATVESGGISPHTFITIYQQQYGKRVKMESFEVKPQKTGFGSPELELGFFKDTKTARLMGNLKAKLKTENISAVLLCQKPS